MGPPSAIKLDHELSEPTVARDAAGPKQNLVRILFVHCSAADVQRYVHELERVRLTVIPDAIVTSEQLAERLHSRSFDLVLAEHPSLGWEQTQVLELLEQLKKDIPLIFLVHDLKRETVAELILKVSPFAITGVTIARFAGGKMVEGFVNWDALGLMQQLGVVPEQAKAKAAAR